MAEKIAGLVFLCSDITEPECVERGLFGGKEKYLNRVKGLEKGVILFSYNYVTKRLIGIFEAETGMEENIIPEAWNGEFPWQVRVRRIETHKALSREDITGVIKTSAPSIPDPRVGVFAERNRAFILEEESATADSFSMFYLAAVLRGTHTNKIRRAWSSNVTINH